jgi:hypothetical protein
VVSEFTVVTGIFFDWDYLCISDGTTKFFFNLSGQTLYSGLTWLKLTAN